MYSLWVGVVIWSEVSLPEDFTNNLRYVEEIFFRIAGIHYYRIIRNWKYVR